MKKSLIAFLVVCSIFLFNFCKKNEVTIEDEVGKKSTSIPLKVIENLKKAGFDTSEGLFPYEDGYLVEYDIYLTEKDIIKLANEKEMGKNLHYTSTNLLAGLPRTFNVFMDTNFSPFMQTAFDNALARYNSLNLLIRFQRTTNQSSANIQILSFFQNSNTLGISGGFPANGNPAGIIRLNTFYYNDATPRADAITVITHEIGHAIGFRHTDFMNRAFSCGEGGNEGENPNGNPIGAVYVPGTPTGPSAGSWMLACSNDNDRPFTSEDVIALNTVYGLQQPSAINGALYWCVFGQNEVNGLYTEFNGQTNLSITPVADATSYTWVVPSDMYITSSTGTSSPNPDGSATIIHSTSSTSVSLGYSVVNPANYPLSGFGLVKVIQVVG
jgi:hypothetical protein